MAINTKGIEAGFGIAVTGATLSMAMKAVNDMSKTMNTNTKKMNLKPPKFKF